MRSLSNDEEGRLVYLAKSFFKIVKKNEGVMMGEDFRQESMVKRTLFTTPYCRSCYRFSYYEISNKFEIGGSEKKRETGAISRSNFPNINKLSTRLSLLR